MKPKMIMKIFVDIAMTVILLLLMSYEKIGQEAHEWIGIAIFVMFIAHHILNHRWSRNLFKGKYTALRILQISLVILVLLSMIGSMVSGIILSRHALSFLGINSGRAFARNLHMLSAYWGFVFMSLHLGIHWGMIMGIARKLAKKPSEVRKWILRAAAALIAGYGVYAFIERNIGSYMLLQNQFVFFDFEEPFILFLFDYITVMGLFTVTGYYLSKLLSKLSTT
ncbi:MAG: DUF4405 domain-containing protein [Lachnospiraceae bacterium]|nr:DUF4405 domain-containing protein [Lachnospiraceae bacterium]